MKLKSDPILIPALEAVVDEITAGGKGIRWWPGEQVAPVAYRRWRSFTRQKKIKAPTLEQRIDDLIKGLQAHFEPDIPYTSYGDWHTLAKPLAEYLDRKTTESSEKVP